MYITQHAVERFRKRYAGGLSHGHALRELIVISREARRLNETAQDGRELWEASDGSGMVLVVARESGGRRRGDGMTCVTVLYGREDVDPVAEP